MNMSHYHNHKNMFMFFFIVLCLCGGDYNMVKGVQGLACNWGTMATHQLPPNVVVKLLKDNGFNKVKLFEAEPGALRALGKSGIQVMVGIPNDLLARLASTVTVAETWVQQNVSQYISKYGTDIRYVAVGNEPFLKTYGDKFLKTTFPALQNIQAALIKAGLGKQVKVTVPLNADVYQTDSGLPSGGDFRADIRDLMLSMVRFLYDSASPITLNIYPFLSLYADPNFPRDYAFFPNGSSAAAPIIDGSITYTNVFDANFDTLISALQKNGFDSNKMEIIVGEVGWPTDGDKNANPAFAQRFNQALLNRIMQRQGTPKRRVPPEIYLFALIDEDSKSVDPGNFERHWGIFYYDGTIKYPLDMANGRPLVPAKGVRYLPREWCVMSPQASLTDPNLAQSVSYACQYADCTSLGVGSSCGNLDGKSNASYAFNMYFQTMDHRRGSCNFNNMSVITTINPSQEPCRFEIQIDTGTHETAKKRSSAAGRRRSSVAVAVAVGWVVAVVSMVVDRLLPV